MSVATIPFPLDGVGAAWTKSPIDREEWPRAARRDWDYLKHPKRQRKREHTPLNRDIGKELGGRGSSRRTVQRGLAFLESIGAIARIFIDGVRTIIVRPLAGEGKEEEAAEPVKPRPRGAPSPSPQRRRPRRLRPMRPSRRRRRRRSSRSNGGPRRR